MKGLVIFKGKYGATRQYAQWLGKSLDVVVKSPEDVGVKELAGYDFLVIGSSVYIGKLLIKDWLRKNTQHLQDKILFFFVVCATPSAERDKQHQIVVENIPDVLLETSDVFFLPGRVNRKLLGWKDRLMLEIGMRLEKDPVRKKAMQQDVDAVRKENLQDLLKAIHSYTSDDSIPAENIHGDDLMINK